MFGFSSYLCILAVHSVGIQLSKTPATPIAYVRDGVFVSGDYVRSALIAEIDGVRSSETKR